MELDWQPNRFFDDTGQWLLCASHGAVYAPDTGEGVAGPCQGGLLKIELTEADGTVLAAHRAPAWCSERARRVIFNHLGLWPARNLPKQLWKTK
jgi:hypothetical protein